MYTGVANSGEDEGSRMAEKEEEYDFNLAGGYQATKTYREANSNKRRQLNRYKKECDISDEHMFLLMFQQDLESVPPEQRTKGDTIMYAMVIVGFLLLWNTLQVAMGQTGGANVPLIFLSVASFVLVAIVYFTGILNPYKRAVRELDKRMKKMPEVPDFVEWSANQPSKRSTSTATATSKSKKKRRR